MAEIESRDDRIAVTMKRADAAALAAIAEIGLDADDALARTSHTAAAERALGNLRASGGTVTLGRPEAMALIAVADTALALVSSRKGSFLASFEGVDIAAAHRGHDQLKGALG